MFFRAVNILPNSFQGLIGEHNNFPIERIRLSPSKNMIASCSHDQTIKFWDVSHFQQQTVATKTKKKSKAVSNKPTMDENFFEDL